MAVGVVVAKSQTLGECGNERTRGLFPEFGDRWVGVGVDIAVNRKAAAARTASEDGLAVVGGAGGCGGRGLSRRG